MNNNLYVSLEQHLKLLSKETMKLIEGYGEGLSTVASRKLIVRFIGHLIEQVIKKSLDEKPSTPYTKSEEYELAKKCFLFVKNDVQVEVADAFNKALKDFSGMDPEYYCQIKVFPEPKNKLSC